MTTVCRRPRRSSARHLARRLLLPGLLLALALPAGWPAEPESGFQSLFDGRSLEGWETPDLSYWSVQEGAITARITREHPCGTNQYLVWRGGELADFELRLKSRLRGEGAINNGFQFRSRLLPDHDIAGYQMDNNLQTDWLVRLYDEFGRHTLAWRGQRTTFDAQGQPTSMVLPNAQGPAWFRLEDWHEYQLVCDGPHITLAVNGRLAAEVTDNDPRRQDASGVLGLQLHSGPPTTAQFKDIQLRVLKPAPPGGRARKEVAPARVALLASALAHWDLGAGGHGGPHPLAYRGALEHGELDVLADGPGAVPQARVARLGGGYFDAGKELNVAGTQVTVYVRARDPRGQWTHALIAKRGNHDRVNFNLFSTDLAETPGPDIGFEVHTERGFVMVSFPVSRIEATAWHDLVGRYDGKSIEVLCDGKVMARRDWAGGVLTQNQEPLLLGGETDDGQVVGLFQGELEEAALWARALSDTELGLLAPAGPFLR